MIVKPYESSLDAELASVLEARNMSLPSVQIPRFSLVAIHEGTLIALGGIREVEGKMGMLDSYITNPEAPPHIRDRALDLITYKLIKIAKQNQLIALMAFSKEPNIIDRAERHGFSTLPTHRFQLLRLN